jgi:hypothetical protein
MDERIRTAKQHLGRKYLGQKGVKGVGISKKNGNQVLRLYVTSKNVSAAKEMKGKTFEGYPVDIKTMGNLRAF